MTKRAGAGSRRCVREVFVDPIERFLNHVTICGECWLWSGARMGRGGSVGQFWVDGKKVPAHRFAHWFWHGPVPNGQEIERTCGFDLCVNPDHQRLVQRGSQCHAKIKPTLATPIMCPEGHFVVGSNAMRPERKCRTCWRRDAIRLVSGAGLERGDVEPVDTADELARLLGVAS